MAWHPATIQYDLIFELQVNQIAQNHIDENNTTIAISMKPI